jgi:hypothetical protein
MKRFVAVSCSHGYLADRKAQQHVIDFCRDFKPHTKIHLGDFTDTTAFRSGARGTADEGKDVDADVTAGLTFLEQLEPDVVFNGNHEDRVWRYLDSPSALISKCAHDTVKHLTKFIRGSLKARYVDHYDIRRSWLRLGPYTLGHGFMFGLTAARDHSEMLGNCIIGHTHAFEVARGRRSGGATCIAVGMLADGDKLTYAHGRAATNKWTTSFISGEYDENRLHFTPHILKESMSPEFERI